MLTHVDWDYVWGLPYFAPMFRSGWSMDIYTLEPQGNIVQTLFGGVHFPIRESGLSAQVHLKRFTPCDELEGIAVQIYPVPLPGGCVGLRVSADDAVVAFSGNCEITGHESDLERLLQDVALAVVDRPLLRCGVCKLSWMGPQCP